MTVDRAQSPPYYRTTWARDVALWFGMLGGPMGWALNQQISYSLVPQICKTGHHAWIHITSIVCLAIALSAGVVALKSLRAQERPIEQEESDSARPSFMAVLGIMSSLFFSLIIVAQIIAGFMVDPCWD